VVSDHTCSGGVGGGGGRVVTDKRRGPKGTTNHGGGGQVDRALASLGSIWKAEEGRM
jgi:hypothetical protein